MKTIGIVVIVISLAVGGTLPMWGEICTETGVYGDPYSLHKPMYTLPVDARVRLHELSHGGTWVMIQPAKWIPLQALCEWK